MPPLTDPPTPVSPKVTAAAAAGTVVTAVLTVAALFGYETDIDADAMAAAVAGVMSLALVFAAWLKRDPLRRP